MLIKQCPKVPIFNVLGFRIKASFISKCHLNVLKILFFISCKSIINLWITDCQVLVDRQSFDIMSNPTIEVNKDTEFMKSSGVSIDTTNPFVLENLETLGKVCVGLNTITY